MARAYLSKERAVLGQVDEFVKSFPIARLTAVFGEGVSLIRQRGGTFLQ
jgi:hypothetical protein